MQRGNKLGEGTFGIVYEAFSPNSNKNFAVKRNLIENAASFIGASREVDILNKIRNYPYVVRLERVTFGHPFNVSCFSPLNNTERPTQKDDSIHFIFGKANYDLQKLILMSQMTDFSVLKRYMVHMLLAVEYIHFQKLIHRDLKPNNVLIFENEKDVMNISGVAKICDFGFTKPYTHQGNQTPNIVTSWYRAPEIALNYPHYDYKSDIWSLGCLFYEMISKRPFLQGVREHNDDIISAILGNLPQQIPGGIFRDLVKNNKWRKVNLLPMYNPKFRKSFMQQIGLSREGIKLFETQAGSMTLFTDLLDKMLTFNWNNRYTATQCLSHPFFASHNNLIQESRKGYLVSPEEHRIITVQCVERKWMEQLVIDIFNKRNLLRWYSDRILFQAMDMFDRYLSAMMSVIIVPPNFVESELKGAIHDKHDAELRFMSCLYLSVKYFSTIHYPVSFDEITLGQYNTKESELVVEAFEAGLIMYCLQYNIYRPTVYEAADTFGDRLIDTDIRDLIILYTSNNNLSGMTPTELYNYYRNCVKNRLLNNLSVPTNS